MRIIIYKTDVNVHAHAFYYIKYWASRDDCAAISIDISASEDSRRKRYVWTLVGFLDMKYFL